LYKLWAQKEFILTDYFLLLLVRGLAMHENGYSGASPRYLYFASKMEKSFCRGVGNY
jgi:hypothetical protein